MLLGAPASVRNVRRRIRAAAAGAARRMGAVRWYPKTAPVIDPATAAHAIEIRIPADQRIRMIARESSYPVLVFAYPPPCAYQLTVNSGRRVCQFRKHIFYDKEAI